MSKKKTSPFLLFRNTLRSNSAYRTPRDIAFGSAIINILLIIIAAFVLVMEEQFPFAIALAISGILFWIFLHGVAQAFFDIADTKLEHLHRQGILDSQKLNIQEL